MRNHTAPRHANGRMGLALGTLLLALAVLAVPAAASAQKLGVLKNNPRLATLNIEIWPEYDRPAALVILRAALAEDVKLPAAVTLRLPAASGGPSGVAYSATQGGNLLNLKHEAVKSGDYVTIKFDVPSRYFHVEFYEPIATTEAARGYRYMWPGDFAADNLTVIVQEPAAATGISVEPKLEALSTGQDGLRYRTAELGKLEAGKPFAVGVRYTKADARPTAETLKPAPEAPAPAPALMPPPAAVSASTASGGGTPEWALPLIALSSLGLLGAGFIFWWWQRESKIGRPAPRVCAKCGAPQPGDNRFCGSCGAKVAAAPDAKTK